MIRLLTFSTLSPGMQRMLRGLDAVHSARDAYSPKMQGIHDRFEGMTVTTSEEANSMQVHPVVRRHAETGADTLFVAHPSQTMRALVRTVKRHWDSGFGSAYNPNRQDALGILDIVSDLDEAIMKIEKRTGMQTRATVLGYIQRGGTPTARDRILGLRFGLKAADLVMEGSWGRMSALHGDVVDSVPLTEATAELKLVPQSWYDTAKTFFG